MYSNKGVAAAYIVPVTVHNVMTEQWYKDLSHNQTLVHYIETQSLN